MSENESQHHGKHEIIIVKKHGGHDHGHHGGAWKIAYADFMTAMMAFFLVMWLINAANEETKAAVASYFNPIKLTDSKPSEKGLQKQSKEKDGQESEDKSKTKSDAEQNSEGETANTGNQETTTAGEKTSYSEADYFENPYAVLSEIALEVGEQANVSMKGEGGASDAGPATGASGGEAFRDPFDPDFWTQQVSVINSPSSDVLDGSEGPGGFPDIAKHGPGDETDIGAEPADNPDSVDLSLTGKGSDVAKQAGGGADLEKNKGGLPLSEEELALQAAIRDAEGKPEVVADETPSEEAGSEDAGIAAETTTPANDQQQDATAEDKGETAFAMLKDEKDHGPSAAGQINDTPAPEIKEPDTASETGRPEATMAEAAAQELRASIQKEIAGQEGKLLEGLTVTAAEGGILISVSDQTETPMFDVGSAVPKPETVLAMERIGKVLSERGGRIVIRGHTDALPFKNGTGDNWTLSVNRARSAYYMLVRGGLAESRIAQVSGYADRMPKIVGDPLNPKNRRIEILVEGDVLSGG